MEDSLVPTDLLNLKLKFKGNNSNTMIFSKRISKTEFSVEVLNNKAFEIPFYVEVFENHQKIYTKNFTLNSNFSKRKIWFLNEIPNGKIKVNESLPVGYVIAEFRAQTTYPEEQHKIR